MTNATRHFSRLNIINDLKIINIEFFYWLSVIDRQTLLDILREIIEEDELRIIRFLLCDTIVNTRKKRRNKRKIIRKQHRVATGR